MSKIFIVLRSNEDSLVLPCWLLDEEVWLSNDGRRCHHVNSARAIASVNSVVALERNASKPVMNENRLPKHRINAMKEQKLDQKLARLKDKQCR